MKTSRTEAAGARQRIVRAAADRFRRDGIAETGLAGFGPEAGLTAGGFYCHFDFQGRVVGRGTRTRVGSGRRYDAGRFGPLRLRIQLRNLRRRLSLGRTSGRSLGFPFAALGSEVARADGLTRSVATNGFLKLSIWLQDPERGENSEQRRHDAIVCGSATIGALTMSRLVSYLQKRRGPRLASVLDELGQLSAFPEGWFASVLADVGSLQVGYAYKSKWYSKEGVRLLRGSNIAPGRVTWDDEVRLPTNLAADFTDPEYR